MITTQDPDIIQVFAKDTAHDVFAVVTWDIAEDSEASMFQIKSELHDPEKYKNTVISYLVHVPTIQERVF